MIFNHFVLYYTNCHCHPFSFMDKVDTVRVKDHVQCAVQIQTKRLNRRCCLHGRIEYVVVNSC